MQTISQSLEHSLFFFNVHSSLTHTPSLTVSQSSFNAHSSRHTFTHCVLKITILSHSHTHTLSLPLIYTPLTLTNPNSLYPTNYSPFTLTHTLSLSLLSHLLPSMHTPLTLTHLHSLCPTNYNPLTFTHTLSVFL